MKEHIQNSKIAAGSGINYSGFTTLIRTDIMAMTIVLTFTLTFNHTLTMTVT